MISLHGKIVNYDNMGSGLTAGELSIALNSLYETKVAPSTLTL